MEIDYKNIMTLPEPPGCTDVSALNRVWELYCLVLTNFTVQANEIGAPDRVTVFAQKQMRYWRREIKNTLGRIRRAEMYNFALRVRSWVLGSKVRRLALRALIGEARIARWQDELALRLNSTPQKLPVPGPVPGSIGAKVAPGSGSEAGNKISVRDWYRLPHLPRQATDIQTGRPPAPRTSSPRKRGYSMNIYLSSACENVARRDYTETPEPEITGMSRAMPAIKFWPHELVADYVADDEALGDLRWADPGRPRPDDNFTHYTVWPEKIKPRPRPQKHKPKSNPQVRILDPPQ